MDISDVSLASLLISGTILGMRHALEADHVATIVGIHRGDLGVRRATAVSLAWGGGHAGVLMAIVVASVLSGLAFTVLSRSIWELPIGCLMLWMARGLFLSAAHDQEGGDCTHAHSLRTPGAAFMIGCGHGIAGTGGLLLLVGGPDTPPRATLALSSAFAFGSILGMIAFTVALSWGVGVLSPQGKVTRHFGRAVDLACLFVGVNLIWRAVGPLP